MATLLEERTYRRAAARAEWGVRLGKFIVWLLLIGGAAGFILPMYLMAAMSLKSASELATTSSWDWPRRVTTENFVSILTNPNISFTVFAKNTLFIAIVSTIGVVLSSALVAYAFARLRFRGRDRLFLVVLSTMMLPGIVTMIPTYVMYAKLQWINTYLPLTVPAFFGGGAFNIFMLRQFFLTLPRELDEAALMDGASHWTIFSRVVMPLSGPALITVAIFSFIGAWRDFMGPLLYLNDPDKQTLELGLRTYQTLNNEQWHLLMAGSVIVTLPLIVIFFVGQKYFVKGIALTGGK